MREFTELFKALTGNEPFPWQQALFDRFTSPEIAARFPSTCDIPTGLGKTSVMAVWLLALAHHALNGEVRSFPRRLVTAAPLKLRPLTHNHQAYAQFPPFTNGGPIEAWLPQGWYRCP